MRKRKKVQAVVMMKRELDVTIQRINVERARQRESAAEADVCTARERLANLEKEIAAHIAPGAEFDPAIMEHLHANAGLYARAVADAEGALVVTKEQVDRELVLAQEFLCAKNATEAAYVRRDAKEAAEAERRELKVMDELWNGSRRSGSNGRGYHE